MDLYDQAATDAAGEPSATDPLTAEQMAAIDPDKLEALGISLAARREDWVRARSASGVEKRWQEDIDQYNGRDDATRAASSMMESVERGFPAVNREAKPQRSTVFVNITRPKSNAAEARVANMLLPSDDRNWGLKPTPDPKLVKAALAQAKQLAAAATQPVSASAAPAVASSAGPAAMPPVNSATMAQSAIGGVAPYAHDVGAQAQLDAAIAAARAMQDEIDDQLIACDYNGELRLMLHDATVLGTGCIKGPIVVNRVQKAWTPQSDGVHTVHVLEIAEETQPASERVDPWNLYPDPGCGEDIHSGRGIFERKVYTSKQLRELVKQPGYLREQIGKVLEEGPCGKVTETSRDMRSRADGASGEGDREHFEVWEYWGEFSPEDLRAAGVEVEDSSTEAIAGCVVIVNAHVIKGYLNPIETGDLPYDFMVWEKVDASCWGYGIPYLIRPSQRVLNAAWRQLMDNAGLSVGPNIVIDPTLIQPVDGRWEITGRKIWRKTDSAASARDAFTSFDFPNNSNDIMAIIKLAQEFIDDESSVPQLMQGEHGSAPDTVGGMALLMNSSNVVLGRMVKQFDDAVTRPHIRRYYDWNMAYNDKGEIKGDFQVDARGTSALLVKDIAHQTMLSLGQFQGSGVIAPMVNWEAWFKKILELAHVDPTDIMKTDAEIAALQNRPPQATPEQVRAQALLQVEQIRAQSAQSIAQVRQQGELQYAQNEQQIAQQDALAKQKEREDMLQLALLNYAHQQRISLQEVQAELAKTTMQEQTKRLLAQTEMQLKVQENGRQHTHELALSMLNNRNGILEQQ